MRINPSQSGVYTRKILRSPAEVDSRDRPKDHPTVPAPQSDNGPRSLKETGTIQGVLTPEESGFISGLFPSRAGEEGGDSKLGRLYSHGGRRTLGALPGVQLDLKA